MPSMNERIQADLMDQERALWTSLTSADPVPAVKKLCNSDVNFILPQTPIVTLDSSGPSLKDVFQPPSYRFDSFSLENTRTIILGMMAGIITYQIKATRGRNMYNATGSSAWVQGSDGEWLLACHQETLL